VNAQENVASARDGETYFGEMLGFDRNWFKRWSWGWLAFILFFKWDKGQYFSKSIEYTLNVPKE
jgi:hypothetical protein